MIIDLSADLAIGRKDYAKDLFPWADALGFDEAGRNLAVSIGDLLIVFDTSDGTRVEEHRLHLAARNPGHAPEASALTESFRDPYISARDLVFTADGQHLIVTLVRQGEGFESVEVHHRSSATRVLRVHDPDDIGDEDAISCCRAAAVSPSGDHLAVAGSRSSVWIFDLTTGSKRELFGPDEDDGPPIAALAFDPSGLHLAIARGDVVDLVEIANATTAARLPLPIVPRYGGEWARQVAPVTIAFSLDGATLIVAHSADNQMATYLVPVAGGPPLTVPLSRAGAHAVVCISPRTNRVWWRASPREQRPGTAAGDLVCQDLATATNSAPDGKLKIVSHTALAFTSDGERFARTGPPGVVLSPLTLRPLATEA